MSSEPQRQHANTRDPRPNDMPACRCELKDTARCVGNKMHGSAHPRHIQGTNGNNRYRNFQHGWQLRPSEASLTQSTSTRVFAERTFPYQISNKQNT